MRRTKRERNRREGGREGVWEGEGTAQCSVKTIGIYTMAHSITEQSEKQTHQSIWLCVLGTHSQ